MTTMTKPGFYKLDQSSDMLRYAANGVYAPNFTLSAADHEAHTYPVEGWHWFDTTEDAEAFFELNGASKARWQEFQAGLLTDQQVHGMMMLAKDAYPGLISAWSTGLGQAATGQGFETFFTAWNLARNLPDPADPTAQLLAPELVAHIAVMATAADLPAEFVAGLNPATIEP